MAPTWIYGVILVVVGSIGNNLGNNLVSLGHRQTHDKTITKGGDLSMNTEYSENPNSVRTDEKEGLCSWCNIGRVVFVVGNLFTFVSFAFGAQSLIASLESIQFVSNVFFVWYVHNEPVTRRMVLATLSIVVGNILVVIFAEHHAKKFTSDDMIYLYKTNYIYHGYLGIAFCVWLITTCIYNNYHHSRMNKRELLWNHSFIEPFMYAMSSAIIGTQAVLNSKCLALLLDSTFSGAKAEFSFWYVYFMLGSWLLLVAYWLTRLDGGLALFPPCFIIPVMQVFFVFFAILCGGIYFQEFVHFTLGQYFGFCSGVMLILAGVYGLAPVDMELHVPGDPKGGHVRIGHCAAATAVVHCEMVESNEGDIESGELDKKIDDTVQIKPQPAPLPEIDLYAVQPNEEDGPVPQMDLSSASARSTNGASKKNRRVVKRPESAERAALPPLQVRGAAAESPFLHGDSTITPATAAGDQTPFTPAPFDHHHHQPEAELPAR